MNGERDAHAQAGAEREEDGGAQDDADEDAAIVDAPGLEGEEDLVEQIDAGFCPA